MKYLVKKTDEGYEVKHQTTASHLPRGGGYLFVDGVDTKYPMLIENEDGTLQIVEDEKPKLIKAAYDNMVDDVYNEMELVFGTRNDASATAFAATWEAMIKRPDNYVDTELGLTNESNVLSHAHAKIQKADEYGKYRMKRIAQFTAEKEGILNETV